MDTIIVGFQSFDDVKKVLLVLKKKGYTWYDGRGIEKNDKEYRYIEVDFNLYQKEEFGGFYLEYKDDFLYGSITLHGEGKQQVNFKDVLKSK